MGKTHLTLYIDNDLIVLAKSSGINLSQEFEQWIRIRMNQTADNEVKEDTELLIAKYRAEIIKLESQAERNKEIQGQKDYELKVLDDMIDNMKQFNENLADIAEVRIHGLQFLFKRKFGMDLNPFEAKEMLLNRIKERGL